MKKYLYGIFVLFFLLFLTGCGQVSISGLNDEPSEYLSKPELVETPPASPSASSQNPLPESYDIQNIPFISQAPKAVWDDLHNEACEEAAVLSVILHLENRKLSKDEADEELIKAVAWQEGYFGGHFDLPMEKTKEFVEKYYQRQVEIIYNPNVEDIKEQIAKGSPLVVPAAGRALGNPNFRQPGPVYHMLVIHGYDDRKGEFITHDVGTRKGENYRYQYQKLYEAIHDMPAWPNKKADLDADPEMIFSGQKAMMVIH